MDYNFQQSDLEEKYQMRIRQLEGETLKLLQEFEGLQKENELLRNKYETTGSGDIITEPYDIVNMERIALKAKVEKYKKKIDELKKERISTFTKIQEQLKSIAMSGPVNEYGRVAQQKVVVVTGNAMDTTGKIKEENKLLTQKIEILEKERDRQEKKIRKLERKLKSIGERDFRQDAVVMDPLVPFMNTAKTGDKPKNSYFQARLHTVPAKRFSSPLPDIRPQTNPLCPPSLYREADYVTLYKRRLSMMSSKTDPLSFSSPSFRD